MMTSQPLIASAETTIDPPPPAAQVFDTNFGDDPVFGSSKRVPWNISQKSLIVDVIDPRFFV